MARALNILTVRKVQALKYPSRHSDGGGLYLRITSAGAKSWVFMIAVGGRRTGIGLGAASALGLAAARELAAQMREAVALGDDPRDVVERQVEPSEVELTFGDFAEECIASVEAGWENATHRQQWRNSLRDHAAAITNKPLGHINTDDVLSSLRPIWLTKAETASRVRGRIERTLDTTKACGLIPRDIANPARLKGH